MSNECFLSSLRDSIIFAFSHPAVETAGYYLTSLRDSGSHLMFMAYLKGKEKIMKKLYQDVLPHEMLVWELRRDEDILLFGFLFH